MFKLVFCDVLSYSTDNMDLPHYLCAQVKNVYSIDNINEEQMGSTFVTMENTDSDVQLLEKIASGDQKALRLLFERYRLSLIQYLQRLTSDYSLAEELLQDTFLAVWKNACSFEGRSSAKAWLFGIARRRAGKILSRRNIPFIDLSNLTEIPTDEQEPEACLLADAAYSELMDAIGRLSYLHQEVLMLVFVYDLSYQEVANVLDVPLGTVKSRLNNAKRSLRELIRSEAKRR
jgi:RNA polymerase sigma-70 factor (ECF subfamily)